MNDKSQFLSAAIDALVQDIAYLSGASFETWGYHLMRSVVPHINWDHRGTNMDGAPIGYTVDSSGGNACFVAQYSSAKDYFTGKKPVDDLDSTYKKHPHVQHIWLLAGVAASPSERTECDNRVHAWCVVHPGVLVTTLDGRQIATIIAENLDSDELVDAVRGGLPTLSRLADEYAISHSLPDRGPYVTRPSVESDAVEQLAKSRYVILAGHSGVGKSDMAVFLAKSTATEQRVWLDASKIHTLEDLKCITCNRRGTQQNVWYLLQRRKCIVILDNLPTLWSETAFLSAVGPDAFLIVTSQFAGTSADAVVVENADMTAARSILEVGAVTSCPDDVFAAIWDATNGHPLLLRLLGRLVQEYAGKWPLAAACCETLVSHGEDDNNEKVCQRILKQHLPTVVPELQFFLWCESPIVDLVLFTACVSPLAKRNLMVRSLLAAATGRTLRLHDIVFKSAQALIALDAGAVARLREKMNGFVRAESGKGTRILERVARFHSDLIERELVRDRSSEAIFAVACARKDIGVVDAFGDLISEAKRLADLAPPPEIGIRAVVEAIEATYSLMSEHGRREEARARLSELMAAIEVLMQANLEAPLALDVRHHRAKMLTRLGKSDVAKREFEAILAEDPEQHGTKLQLVRIHAGTNRERASDLAKEIVAIDAKGVPLSIKIAAWAELSRLKPEFVATSVPQIVTTLRQHEGDSSAACGLVATVASALSYIAPTAALKLFETIKDGEPVFSSDRERLDWARAHVAAAKALRDIEGAQTAAVEDWLVRAKTTYDVVGYQRMPEFNRVQFAECLILLNEYQAATAILDSVQETGRNAFWQHRYAQARLGDQDFEGATVAIERALAMVGEGRFRSAFLEVRADIRVATGLVGAREDLLEAARLTTNEKYQSQLRVKAAATSNSAH